MQFNPMSAAANFLPPPPSLPLTQQQVDICCSLLSRAEKRCEELKKTVQEKVTALRTQEAACDAAIATFQEMKKTAEADAKTLPATITALTAELQARQKEKTDLATPLTTNQNQLAQLTQEIASIAAGCLILKNLAVFYPAQQQAPLNSASAAAGASSSQPSPNTTQIIQGLVKMRILHITEHTASPIPGIFSTCIVGFTSRIAPYEKQQKMEEALKAAQAELTKKTNELTALKKQHAADNADLQKFKTNLEGCRKLIEPNAKEYAAKALESGMDPHSEEIAKSMRDSKQKVDANHAEIRKLEANIQDKEKTIKAQKDAIPKLEAENTNRAAAIDKQEKELTELKSKPNFPADQVAAFKAGLQVLSSLPVLQMAPSMPIQQVIPSAPQQANTGLGKNNRQDGGAAAAAAARESTGGTGAAAAGAGAGGVNHNKTQVNAPANGAAGHAAAMQELRKLDYSKIPKPNEFEMYTLHYQFSKSSRKLNILEDANYSIFLNTPIEGWTPLCVLILNANASTLNTFMCNYRPDVTIAAPGGWDPLKLIASQNKLNLKSINPAIDTFFDLKGKTKPNPEAAHTAAFHGNHHTLDALFSHGLNPAHVDSAGWSVLHILAAKGDVETYNHVREYLVDHLKQLAPAHNNITAPMIAANIGHAELLKALARETQIDFGMKDSKGWDWKAFAENPSLDPKSLALPAGSLARQTMIKEVTQILQDKAKAKAAS